MALNHIIGEQRFDIRLDSLEGANELQHNLSRHFWNELAPALEKLFDRLAGSDVVIRIPKLEIDMGTLSRNELLSHDFILRVTRQIEEALSRKILDPGSDIEVSPAPKGHFNQWLFFLEHGYLPYEAAVPESLNAWQRGIFETLAVDHLAIRRLGILIESSPVAFIRLLSQHDASFLQQIAGIFTGRSQSELTSSIDQVAQSLAQKILHLVKAGITRDLASEQDVLRERIFDILPPGLRSTFGRDQISRISTTMHRWFSRLEATSHAWTHEKWQASIRNELWREVMVLVIIGLKRGDTKSLVNRALQQSAYALWNPFIGPTPKAADFDVLLSNAENKEKIAVLLDEHDEKKFLENMLLETEESLTLEENDAWYIENAGLVLLHPFYPTLFKKLELLEEGVFKDRACECDAISLLHFIGSGELEVPEYKLVLPKILCGLPVNLPPISRSDLEEDIQSEAEAMMRAAIAHWEALGSVSPDGLREGFLQRPGKLEKREGGWFLRVESRTLDILLDRIPWNVGLVKLPWMKELLHVEWR